MGLSRAVLDENRTSSVPFSSGTIVFLRAGVRKRRAVASPRRGGIRPRASFPARFKSPRAPADTPAVRQRGQPEAETFYERPLSITIRLIF
jgi:hypothetical protein